MKIAEEPAHTHIQYLLDTLPHDLSPVERLILCSDGLVQAHLSVLFRVPVVVEVVSQDVGEAITRNVRLVARYPHSDHVTACHASSLIPFSSNNHEFIEAIKEKRLGIGEILRSMKYNYSKQISSIYADEHDISREYTITGDGLYVSIREVFSRQVLAQTRKVVS